MTVVEHPAQASAATEAATAKVNRNWSLGRSFKDNTDLNHWWIRKPQKAEYSGKTKAARNRRIACK
ncbi:MAG: hypothetical protein QOF19_149 [Alphaproteobacteria bacterium]|nr:hypothetical protein [Alphaproteobacteria bacterium]